MQVTILISREKSSENEIQHSYTADLLLDNKKKSYEPIRTLGKGSSRIYFHLWLNINSNQSLFLDLECFGLNLDKDGKLYCESDIFDVL